MSMVNDMMNTIPTGTLLADASKWPLFDMWFMNKSASTYGGS
jgi:hypothetical protein